MHRFHIFVATFASEVDAASFTEKQWEPEPGDEASDEEYAAWEGRNPSWPMRAEQGFTYLDGDFVETIWGDGDTGGSDVNWRYLASLVDSDDAARCRDVAPPGSNTLVIIHQQALGGFDISFRSTSTMTYCGCFQARG
ncbi:hypothetical protein [Mesorhizobium sp. 1M-11]|uniref:hypothetical protein n=1 Tax=Mesorhizobium sp. 1M-11 TaxID=1529006 RepID=UPI00128F6716|nr:hypothetical protein [Mesorhizobium sp. 1M-11]